jgi:lipoate-protein ligase B
MGGIAGKLSELHDLIQSLRVWNVLGTITTRVSACQSVPGVVFSTPLSELSRNMMIKTKNLNIQDLGIRPYGEVLDLQLDLCQQRQADAIDNTVLIVEHPPVITLGARKSENKLLKDEAALLSKGIDVVHIHRGGGTTAHNPGQLVLYPIIRLKSVGLDVSSYVRTLEQIGIDLLGGFGVHSGQRKGFPGLWIGEKKIASIGVQLKKWVSFHGMAININNDLSIFNCIVPCGLDGVEMTSVEKETCKKIDMSVLKKELTHLCMKAFNG